MFIQDQAIILASEPPVLPPVTWRVSPCHDNFSEFLEHQLSCKSGQESLYDLPSELAGGVIDYLEQVRAKQPPSVITNQPANVNKGSREDSGLCASDREKFSTAFRKMCCIHKLLPSSCAMANELERVEEFPSRGGGSADVFCGWYQGSKVAIKRIRHSSNRTTLERVSFYVSLFKKQTY